MMADRRRRSPELPRRGQEYRRSEYSDEQPRTGMRSGAESIYSSSPSSVEVIDISHSFPPNRSGIVTFFTAPSERRLRKRRSSRLLRHNNSSSDSIGDLAYGHGYLRRPKRMVRSRRGKEIDRERYSERERVERYSARYSDREKERSGIGRAATDAEILAVGAGLATGIAKLAREQNKAAARNGKQVYGVKESGRRDDAPSRGLAPSKVSHGSGIVDEDGWESATDAESESSVDSRLAYGAESQGGWGFFGRKRYTEQTRKSSVVDPQLFGPANSLHGVVTEPVGFGEVSWNSSSDFGQHPFAVPPAETIVSGSQQSMRYVYPIATDDSTRFDAGRSSVVSGAEPFASSRPAPIPIQQPQPINVVSQSVYDPIYATRSDTGTGILKKTPTSAGKGKSIAEAALFGVAGAAVGAAIASERRDDRKERRRDDDREGREESRTVKDQDSDQRDTMNDRRHKRGSPDREERKEKRREKERLKDSQDGRSDKKREKRRDGTREETREERRERRREEKRIERGEDPYDRRRSERFDEQYEPRRAESDTVVSKIAVDPFQYQVDNDTFATPNNEPAIRHDRIQSFPTVVTVEREPDFTRKRSSSIKEQPVVSRSEAGRKDYAQTDERDSRDKDSYRDLRDRPLHEAESIYQQTEHFTAPIDAAAISAAIAAEGYRESRSERRRDERRGERRRDYDDGDYEQRKRDSKRESKDYGNYDRKSDDKESARESRRERPRDPIQEEADRAYREIVMARKIASEVIRSRSPSPNRSVVDKYQEKEEEIVRIVTPPGMDDSKKKGPYDAPNADFTLDYVLEHPREIRRFSLPPSARDLSNSESLYLKKDPDATLPRPLLNLVLPTPSPSPSPEKQISPSDPARSSKQESQATTASDVVIGPKGNVVPSTTTSAVSKGVTWGENETKHFEVESPSEHRDEFVSSPEVRIRGDAREDPSTEARDNLVDQPRSANASKRSGWGAIAAGIIGAGAGAAIASSSDTSKSSKSSKTKDTEKKQDASYEYRGVIVEPESPPRTSREQSPPTISPKPSESQVSQISRVPGSFDDDIDFTATVAAGLQDTGFDPDIVINDPSFRRRNSPPGSNGPSFYQAPYAETVSDLGSVLRDAPVSKDAQGSVLGDVVTTPRDWPTVSHSEEETTSRLTRNEQKKHEKARRQSGDFAPVEEGSKFAKAEIFDEPESYFDEPKKKSKKSKSGSGYDNYTEEASRNERGVAVPVDAFDDLRNGEEDWSETKKSKRKSRVDGDRYDFPSQSAPSDVASPQERRSTVGKKSKDKSKRKSDSYEPEPTEVSLPPSVPSESSRDGDFDDIRRTRKSSNKDSGDRGGSRSVVSADGSRYDDEPRKNKKKSKSRDDFDDTRSVASAPTGDDFDDKKSKKKDRDKRNSGGFFGLFGLKSDMVSRDDTPRKSKDDSEDVKKSKKSKRASLPDASSIYGDIGSQTVTDLSRNTSNGNSNGNSAYNTEEQDRNSRNEIQEKSRSRDESEPLKKDSFLAKAGTLGAGVGLAGAVIAIAAQRRQQSNADSARQSNETAEQTRSRGSSRSRQLEDVDPEITQRQYRPSIDPQYGDLLPLPPSSPESPNFEPTDDLPDLPDSRPDTPEADRLAREIAMASIRKSVSHDATQMKSPSHSAVPLKFFMGSRSSPSSPGPVRGSQSQSPATPIHDSPHFPRSRPRPTSWENTNEYKPLYLVETNRRGSNIQQEEFEVPLPALPPSQGTSRASSQLDSSDEAVFEDAEQYPRDLPVHFEEPLSIDTGLAKSLAGLLDSEQSTPKAGIFQYLDADQSDEQLPEHNPLESSSRHAFRSVSPPPDDQRDFHAKTAADIIAGAAVGSSIAHFASSQIQSPTDKSPLGELPSHSEAQRQPFPVDPMTKDRSSYLLQSSPMSRKTEDDDSAERIEDSPTNRHQPPQFAGDSLNSIQEGHENDVFDHSDKVNPQVEQERERTLNALSGHELPELQETASDYGEGFLTTESRELAAIDSKEEAEPAEQLAFTKSKKGKKKDKKKGKGVPWSSTPEDFTETETSQDPFGEPSAPVSVDTTEEFSLTKSKKDKKKGKGISRTSTQDNFFEEPSRDSYDEPSAAVDVGPTEEFSTTKSKKDKKKDKKRGKSTPAWEPEEGSNVPTADKYSDNAATVNVLEEKSAQDDFATADTKKGKKNDKRKRKSMTALENEVEQPPYPPIDPIQEPANEAGRDILEAAVPVGLGIAAYEELKPSEDPGSSTQHGKEWQAPEDAESRELKVLDFQEQGKPSEFPLDQSSPTQEAREELSPKIRPEFSAEAGREAVEEASVPVNSVASVTEQTKQQAASTPVSAWVSSREPEKEQAAPSLHIQELDLPPSKQSENGKEFQSRTTEEIFASEKAEPIEAPTEKNEDREITKTDINEPPVIESDQIASFQRPATPASPPTGFVEEASNSEYFPSTAALHRPASHKPQSSDDKTGSVYFPSAAAILPVAAAGAAIIAAEHFDKTSDESADPESSSSRVVEGESSRSTEPDTTSARPIPDGLKAGYDSEQLSLARRLQEMFSSGSKKSKKDKKKRQSLSATPDRDVSRSRGPDEASEDHHRARSLSIGPSRAKSSDRPMSEDRKNLYSEDQLEVARNLKAEFESGGKKSKKDKKKRQDLSRNSTQDDYVFNQPIEESQSIEPENIEGLTVQEQAVSSRDGFDAGYQEDQLSLARQLQAEFGSKKSKKDKKRRSTPQTPTQGPELQTDDFAETSQIPIEESSRNLERSGAPEPSVLDTSRDGLAVGYNEDQVELARQLNEEFSSGSKKSKKDKKKRQGLLRNTTEDDFSSDSTPKDVTESRDVEYQDAGSAELQPNEPSPARPEDEFALTGKKSKKDKKRQSLLRNTTEDDFSSDHAPQDGTQPRDFESQNASTVEPGPSEITLTEPDDQSAFTSKKSKKDKKSKKRDSIATATTAEVSSETISNDIEEPPQGYVQEENAITESNAPTPAEAEDEFAFTTKKSKKDKKGKNRESLVPATQNDESPADIAAKDLAETALAGAGIEAVSTEPLAEIPEDEFGLTRKKSRKDKKGQKRDSLLRSTTANDTPSSDDFGKAVEALHNTRDVPSNEHAAASFENDWASSAKSVDAEEREHFTAKEDSWDSPMLNDDSAQFQASEELSTAEVTATSSGTDAVNDSTDGFGFSSKKSKKDKKKRQSLLRSSSTYEDTPEQGNKEADLPQESTSKEIMETAAPALGLAEEQDGVYGSTSKKLKKDKKKRQSSQLSFAEEVPRTVDELSIAQQVPPVVEDFDKDVEERAPEAIISDTSSQRALGDSSLEKVSAEPIEGDAEAQFEKFAFTTKSSKKGKKKRKGSNMPDSDEPSGVSTTINPIDETPAALVESPLPPDIPPESSEAARELWSRQVEESIPVDAAADEILANPADEWESFSSKKYKTDKELPSQWDVAEVKEPKSEKLEDLVDDELGSFNTKKSKKDKKKRKSGLSTSLEALPEPERSPLKEIPKERMEQVAEINADPEPAVPGDLQETKQQEPTERVAETIAEPEPEIPVLDDFQETGQQEPVPTTFGEILHEPTHLEGTSQEPDYDVPKDARDTEELKPVSKEPVPTTFGEILDEAIPQLEVAGSERDFGSQRGTRETEWPKSMSSEPVDDEGASFITNQSRKDKKRSKSDKSTTLRTLAEPESSTSQREVSKVEEPKSQLDELLAGGVFTTKKAKENKNQSEFTVPPEDTSQPEGAFQEFENGIKNPEPQHQESLLRPEAPSHLESREVGETELYRSLENAEEDQEPVFGPEATSHLEAREIQEYESQHSLMSREPEHEESFVEPDVTSHHGSRDIQESELQNSVDDEWAAFTAKKSKKDKETKSGTLKSSGKVPQLESSSQEDQVKDEAVLQQVKEAGEEERGLFTTEKGTGKLGLSTPIEETAPPDIASREEDVDHREVEPLQHKFSTQPNSVEQEQPQSRLFSTETPLLEALQFQPSPTQELVKPQSHLLSGETPPKETTEPVSFTQQDSVEKEELQSQLPSAVNDSTTADIDQARESGQVALEFLSKKSKKDKKKRKSGLSTPAEDTVPSFEREETYKTQLPAFDAPEVQSWPSEPDGGNEQASRDAAFEFMTKKSKKDKKRKSGLSTPVEGKAPSVESESLSREFGFDMPATELSPAERDIFEPQAVQNDSQMQPSGPTDDSFEFTTKKAKKDRKGKKRASLLGSESGPSSSATPSSSTPPIDVSVEDQSHLVSKRLTQSPGTFVKDLSAEQNIAEPDPNSTYPRETPFETQVIESDEVPFDLGRKPSKKDKRKRQAIVANVDDGPSASQTAMATWADEVEDAEAERDVTVSEDIAKDASPSYIASTTETAPIDDFSRSSKKGKKGKKRNSEVMRDSSKEDSFHSRISEDASKQQDAEHSDIPVLVATGAALAGAVCLAKKSEEEVPEPVAATAETEGSMNKAADILSPARKLSKKAKRQQSIDRRAPKDDPFDDPALWEGAQPKAFEELREANNDTGSDGFWSANVDEQVSSEERPQALGNLHTGPVDLFPSDRNERAQEPIDELDLNDDSIPLQPLRELPSSEQGWNDSLDGYIRPSSENNIDEKKQSRLAEWNTPDGHPEVQESDLPPANPTHHMPGVGIDEPHIEQRTPSEPPTISPINFVQELPVDRDISFQDSQFRPRNSLRYSAQGSPSLPVVREESPAQMESNHFHPTSFPPGADDVNRDSAFVTESPIPGQKPFAGESIRDSGVHLREPSPLERAVAPVSMSDDAIARLSWPAVDEALEAVDLHRSQRPKVDTPPAEHHDEETISVQATSSHVPFSEDRDVHLSHTSDNILHRRYEERQSLPSQIHNEDSHTDLHRTQTIRRLPIEEDRRRHRVHRFHGPEDEDATSQIHDAALRDIPLLRHEEPEEPLRHRVHRSDIEKQVKADKSRSEDQIISSLRPEEERSSDLHRTQTIHRSQKPDSLVKQRVQGFENESPPSHRPSTPKGDRYGNLSTSHRSKAEKPSSVSDSAIVAATAIAGAGVGFAAARQASRENRPESAQSQRSSNINRLRTPDPKILRPDSVGSNRSLGTPPLRRSDRKSGDLRSLSQRSNLDLRINH